MAHDGDSYQNAASPTPDPVDAIIGANLRRRRMVLGMGLEITAVRAGMQPDLLMRVEDGMTRANADQIKVLSSTLDMSTTAAYAGITDSMIADEKPS